MRRFERMAIGRASLSLFVTEEELQLADEIAPRADKLFIPNVLPREEVERAEALREARSRRVAKPVLAYMGTLTYPPNRAALGSFLKHVWPHLRESRPDLQLTVVGASSEGFSTVPGVKATGFVSDLTTILRDVSAVVLPFDAGGGSSLRVLFYALADVPVVGSPAAFRGFPPEVGLRASSVSDWTKLVTEVLADGAEKNHSMAAARDAATARQNATEPWDALNEALRKLTGRNRAA
jgi:hypothetical protein